MSAKKKMPVLACYLPNRGFFRLTVLLGPDLGEQKQGACTGRDLRAFLPAALEKLGVS